MANVNFGYGTKANYDKLTTKDANTLYFITDTRQIFKGTDEYTKSCIRDPFTDPLHAGIETDEPEHDVQPSSMSGSGVGCRSCKT